MESSRDSRLQMAGYGILLGACTAINGGLWVVMMVDDGKGTALPARNKDRVFAAGDGDINRSDGTDRPPQLMMSHRDKCIYAYR